MTAEARTPTGSSRPADAAATASPPPEDSGFLALLTDRKPAAAYAALAAKRLVAGDIRQAFLLADRQCRVTAPRDPDHLVLRAEISSRLGDENGAIADVREALRIDPANVQANRRLLTWVAGDEQLDACVATLQHDTNPDALRFAVATLAAAGRRIPCARVRFETRKIGGWVAASAASVRIVMTSAAFNLERQIPLKPVRDGAALCFAAFSCPLPVAALPLLVTLYDGGEQVHSAVIGSVAVRDHGVAVKARHPDAGRDRPDKVTIVIPVHGDAAATSACLRSVAGQMPSSRIRQDVLLVDDAAPGCEMRRLIGETPFRVLSNRTNLGFARSVNRALAVIEEGDVILLNADTVVGPGFADRLSAAAYASGDIGTVTPLSNNGEYTSFPVPFRINDLPSREEILEIDRTASEVNAGAAVDLPNGVGFCLYITRRGLDVVPRLPEIYGRGYYEDEAYCHAVRRAGLRSIAAAGVFVGHHGSRSFGRSKRELVVKNERTLLSHFPESRLASASFVHADPLKPWRRRLEAALPERAVPVLMIGPMETRDVALFHAREIAGTGESVTLLSIAGGMVDVRRIGSPGDAPSNLSPMQASDALARFLPRAARLVVLDPTSVPGEALASVRSHAAVDVVLASALSTTGNSWLPLVRGARTVTPLTSSAAAFLEARCPDVAVAPALWSSKPAARSADPPCVGLVAGVATAASLARLGAIAAAVRSVSSAPITVLGSTPDDAMLMSIPGVHVTGRVDLSSDARRLVRNLGLSHVVTAIDRRPIFADVFSSCWTDAGVALAEWSFADGRGPGLPGCLHLDLALSDAESGRRLAHWVCSADRHASPDREPAG